jgi:alpha-tubulin suppressor-like RCC1 family protein
MARILLGSILNQTTAEAPFLHFAGFDDPQMGAFGYTFLDFSGPVQSTDSGDYVDIDASRGGNFVFAVKSNGTLWCWGSNTYGQLGLGDTLARTSPTQVGSDTNWSKVAVGAYHVLAVKTNGTLWSWGFGSNYGQLGQNDSISRSSPTQIGTDTNWSDVSSDNGNTFAYTSAAIKTDGTLWTWGAGSSGGLGHNDGINRSSPTQVGTDTDWVTMEMGVTNTFAIKTNGTLWCWGLNANGQLGLGDVINRSSPVQLGTDTDWSAVNASYLHTCALKTTGTLWGWGNNTYGLLGLGNTVNRSSPEQVGTDTDWSVINIEYYTMYYLKSTGEAYASGYNVYRQITADKNSKYTPTQIGSSASWSKVAASGYLTLLLGSDGNIYTQGADSGMAYLYSYNSAYNPFNPVPMSFKVKHVNTIGISPYYNLCFVKTDGTLWTTGYNNYGPLGTGNTTSQSSINQVGTDTDWEKAYGSSDSTLAIKSNGTIWACGRNTSGQLGQNTVSTRENTLLQIDGTWSDAATGNGFMLGIKSDGTLWSWGGNTYGQLGQNDVVSRSSPTQIGTDSNWSRVFPAQSYYYTFGLKTDGTLWSWGFGLYYGQLGVNQNIHRSSPTQIGTDTNWSYVSANFIHALALRTDGTLWGWGDGDYGKLGLGILGDRSSPVQIGTDSDWYKVSAGYNYSLAMKNDGSVWGWGYNARGELGVGDVENRSSPVQVGASTNWTNIEACSYFSYFY